MVTIASWPGESGGTATVPTTTTPTVPVTPKALVPRGERIEDEPDTKEELLKFFQRKQLESKSRKEYDYWSRRIQTVTKWSMPKAFEPITKEEKEARDRSENINVEQLANAMLLLAGVGATIASVIPIPAVSAAGIVGKAAVLNTLVYQSGNARAGYSRGVNRTGRTAYPSYGPDKGNHGYHKTK